MLQVNINQIIEIKLKHSLESAITRHLRHQWHVTHVVQEEYWTFMNAI